MSFSSSSRIQFPSDLFYSHIIPDLLSEYLDQFLLAEHINFEWNPFYTLPLVSRSFCDICRMMSENIFGVKKEEDRDLIRHVLWNARWYWDLARLPPARAMTETLKQLTYGQLMSSESLIQVYICTAIASFFFNADVLCVFALENQVPRGEDPDSMDLDRLRRFRMRDDTMHRVYLPLTCAMKLCDRIVPERLAYTIVDHLADIAPRFSTEPVLLKYTQDLETYVVREHRVDLGTWIEWTIRTLSLIEGTNDLLKQMLSMGKLVESNVGNITIPQGVLDETNIVAALSDVMAVDWGAATKQIHELAEDIFLEFTPEESELDSEEFDPEE